MIDSTIQGTLSKLSEQFGIAPGDVLQLTRVFVLVEGEHDEIVLNHLLADDLGKASAQTLALRGAKGLRSVVEAKFLFSSTEAMFLVVLDGLLMDEVRPIWDEARGHANAGNIREARGALAKLKGVPGGGELKWLEELGHAALNTAKFARIEVHGLKERDIVMYLPEGCFMDTSKTWAQLDQEYEAYCRPLHLAERRNFKEWLRDFRGAHFGRDDIVNAVHAASPSTEIQQLGINLQTLARFGRADALEIL
ncbi:hypothetical protein [Arthrobacter terricola]|uniref:Uncharacterized protein n=1 Tax=Arthrobacter terricola TaxID=2547396 RepID=A0A4R5KA09_9MICC|nr:hypothetical protein [Arthrobacter terricola]MBT8163151.1 hypothetical protein [Arthrobacter sp. GN70]TDF91278.1 hypothetical protein E1809_21190 [Arthrobacter terricola]